MALDPANGSLDGEVNSHAAWPTADGTVVVETEEDFNAWEPLRPLSNVTFGEFEWNTIPGVGISTLAGDDFETNQTRGSPASHRPRGGSHSGGTCRGCTERAIAERMLELPNTAQLTFEQAARFAIADISRRELYEERS